MVFLKQSRPRVEPLEDRCLPSANVVLEWNQLALDAIRATGMNPLLASRAMAITQAAVYDSVNAIDRSYAPYFADVHASRGASLEAAAAQAAHDTLAALFPSQMSIFDTKLAADLVGISPGRARQGAEVGHDVAQQILAWRSTDGSGAVVPYTPGTNPGDWQPTPPAFLAPLGVQWPDVTPFAMTVGSQFLPPPPPALDSGEYLTAFDEVVNFGGNGTTTPTERDADQTEIARFWADGAGTSYAFGHWNEIAQGVSVERDLDLVTEARLFALLNIATADAVIVAWDAKYEYNFWRPITAIRATSDPAWTPLLGTPNFPSHTSGHSTVSSAAATVLTGLFGPDYSFTVGSEGLAGVTRSFASFDLAAAEAGQSRIYGGIHFQFENQGGLASGHDLGQFVVGNFLLPVEKKNEGRGRHNDHTGFVAEPGPGGPAGASPDTAATTWSVQIGTAPNAVTNAAGMPQDIHLTATGNNAEGWHGAGVTTLLGNLAQFLDFGQRAVLQAHIVEGGLIGIDGTPVLPGTYLAPSPQLGDRTFEVVSGRTFYLIVDFTVVNSNITDSVVGPIPVGATYRVMLTFDAVEGRSEQPLVEWLDFGGGFFPFVNEGVMSTNLRLG